MSASVEAVTSTLLPVAIVGGISLSRFNQELVGEQSIILANAVTVSLVLAIVVVAPVRAALVPHAPTCRLGGWFVVTEFSSTSILATEAQLIRTRFNLPNYLVHYVEFNLEL